MILIRTQGKTKIQEKMSILSNKLSWTNSFQKDQSLQIFHEGIDYPLVKSKLDQAKDFLLLLARQTCLLLKLISTLPIKPDM